MCGPVKFRQNHVSAYSLERDQNDSALLISAFPDGRNDSSIEAL